MVVGAALVSSSERNGDVLEIISDLLLSIFSVPGFPRNIKLAFVGAGEGVQCGSDCLLSTPVPRVSFYPVPESKRPRCEITIARFSLFADRIRILISLCFLKILFYIGKTAVN